MQGVAGLGTRPIKVSIAVQKAKDPSMPPGPTPPTPSIPFPPAAAAAPPSYARPVTAGYPAGGPDYAPYYNQYNHYWSNMAAWQQYNQYYQAYPGGPQGPPEHVPANPPLPPNPNEEGHENGVSSGVSSIITHPALQFLDEEVSILEGPLNQPVEHSKPIDYYKLNRMFFSSSADLYDSLEESGWGNLKDNV
eukprot:TRINITY_DN1147_c0_g1_i6.p1 TRINITY_DN1147_c0_g1~~TRINITY_DN1147_c0_g1_i6.p1  ORF type:complete len:192 (-),score=41.75 TRINITY_DN1147_c0_g1_i6:301-876(-)